MSSPDQRARGYRRTTAVTAGLAATAVAGVLAVAGGLAYAAAQSDDTAQTAQQQSDSGTQLSGTTDSPQVTSGGS